MTGDITHTRVQAAEQLLNGRERIAAKEQGVSVVQAARDQYGADALAAVETALDPDDDRVKLTHSVLAAIRDGDDLDSITAGATDVDGRVYRLHGVAADDHGLAGREGV